MMQEHTRSWVWEWVGAGTHYRRLEYVGTRFYTFETDRREGCHDLFQGIFPTRDIERLSDPNAGHVEDIEPHVRSRKALT